MASAELTPDDLALLLAVLRQSSTPMTTADLVAALRSTTAPA